MPTSAPPRSTSPSRARSTIEPNAEWCGEDKPEGDEGDDGEWFDPPEYYELDRADVAKLVFGAEFYDNILKCYC